MNVKLIVFTGLISVFLWGICLYNGWLKEMFLFGYNIYSGFFDKNTPGISTNENVTTIKYGKFAYRFLGEIDIPDNIKIIEKNAFKGNKLTSVTIGQNVTLGRNAIGNGFEVVYNRNGKYAGTYTRTDRKSKEWFTWYDDFRYENNNGNIVITGYRGTENAVLIPAEINGNPVKIIGNRAFIEKNFTSVVIPDSVTIIEEMAFFGVWDRARELPLGTISSVTIGKGVTTIGDRVFENNFLSGIIIPDSVTSIGYSAFADNPVTIVSIGANVLLGSTDNDSSNGVLGASTGFNTAYDNNNRREGIYTRPNTNSTTWTRSSRSVYNRTNTIIAYNNSLNVSPKPGTFYSRNGHSYEVIDQTMIWANARSDCERRGGYLATITSSEEQSFIMELLSRTGNKSLYWLGGYREGSNWKWVTNESSNYRNWMSGKPDNFNNREDKLLIIRLTPSWGGSLGQWDDINNSGDGNSFGYICEWD
jgi:hypothetical protein